MVGSRPCSSDVFYAPLPLVFHNMILYFYFYPAYMLEVECIRRYLCIHQFTLNGMTLDTVIPASQRLDNAPNCPTLSTGGLGNLFGV